MSATASATAPAPADVRDALRAAGEALRRVADLVDVTAERLLEPPVPAPAPSEEGPLTPAAAARLLGVSPSFVRDLCATGAVKAFKTEGGHYRIRRVELARYERRRTR